MAMSGPEPVSFGSNLSSAGFVITKPCASFSANARGSTPTTIPAIAATSSKPRRCIGPPPVMIGRKERYAPNPVSATRTRYEKRLSWLAPIGASDGKWTELSDANRIHRPRHHGHAHGGTSREGRPQADRARRRHRQGRAARHGRAHD